MRHPVANPVQFGPFLWAPLGLCRAPGPVPRAPLVVRLSAGVSGVRCPMLCGYAVCGVLAVCGWAEWAFEPLGVRVRVLQCC
jgi:hypothetical protein